MVVCPRCGAQAPPRAQFCPACAAPLSADTVARADVRKVVTVLFCDVVGSTKLGERLDPEALRTVMARYFDEMRAVIEHHGGTVEKFIGDAVMGVFGVPVVHEDDALRGVRAAIEMRERLRRLNIELERERGVRIEARMGLNTGEVVAGEPSDHQRLVTGDTVNAAKRLEEAASVDEILIGDLTRRLVDRAVELEAAGTQAAKGKTGGVAAWRVQALVQDGAFAASPDSPLVGRAFELAQLRHAYEQVALERRCRLVTVLGPAGIGKSRLVRELAAAVGDEATFVKGRCLPYGDGITFWPLVEIVRQVGGERGLETALAGTEDAEVVAERLRGVVGLSEATAGAQETFWAVRALLEALARDRPLVVCIEDIHWAEPTLLDLIEYLVGWVRDGPILLLCPARPELLDAAPAWTAPRANASVLVLDRLSPADSDTLLAVSGAAALDDETRARIAASAEGNPLFVEQMVAMVAESGGKQARVMPPTIQALLAARLERLTRDERVVIERASVVGREFPVAAVADLSPLELRSDVGRHLLALVRRGLVRPERTAGAREDAFRFQHVLIRDAAYRRMPKELRAELHERFATWIQRNRPERELELEELVGYHLEQAFRYREQLRPVDATARALATHAGELLGAAGRRAFARDDMPAAIKLLDRAVALLTAQDASRLELVRELSSAFWAVGEVARAEALLTSLIEAASEAADRRVEWYALLERAARRQLIDPSASGDDLAGVAERAIEVFEELDDDLGLARAWRRLAAVAEPRGHFGAAEAAIERALEHARRAGDRQEEARSVDRLCTCLLYGPTAADEGIRRCEEMLERAQGNPLMEANILGSLAGLKAMRGDFDAGRTLCERSERAYEQLGLRLPIANATEVAGTLELLAGNAREAERALRRGYEILAGVGSGSARSFTASLLATALFAQGRYDEADELAQDGERTSGGDDVGSQIRWRAIRARLEAWAGGERAEQLAREAVALAETTDASNLHGDALLELASVLAGGGHDDEATAALQQARELYERKGNLVSRDRAATLLAERIG